MAPPEVGPFWRASMIVRGRLRTFLPAPSAVPGSTQGRGASATASMSWGSRCRTQFGFGLLAVPAVLAGFFLALADEVALGFVAACDWAATSASLGGAGGAVAVTAAGSDGGG